MLITARALSLRRPSVAYSSTLGLVRSFNSAVPLSSSSLPPSTRQPAPQPRNEAEEYLANKAARKQQHRAGQTDPNSAKARHASFYTDILPSLLRVFAYGSAAYFSLHLLWNLLDRDEQRQLMAKQTGDLETQIQSVTEKVHAATASRDRDSKASLTQTTEQGATKRSWWPF